MHRLAVVSQCLLRERKLSALNGHKILARGRARLWERDHPW